MAKPFENDYVDYNRGREAYRDSPKTYVPGAGSTESANKQRHLLSIRAEERLGSLIAAGGIIWATYVATVDYANLWRMQIMPPGPVEVCVLGILAWLHAKWRRSAKLD